MNHDISNIGWSTQHFSARQNLFTLLKKILGKDKYWQKLLIEKVNIDTINWEKFFDRSADYK